VTPLAPLVSGDLTVEPQMADADAIELFFRGRSNDRHPARVVVPYVSEAMGAALTRSIALRLHFETLEYMNSSTITAIIQIIQEARGRGARLEMVFDATKSWQRLGFEALAVFAKGDELFKLVGIRP